MVINKQVVLPIFGNNFSLECDYIILRFDSSNSCKNLAMMTSSAELFLLAKVIKFQEQSDKNIEILKRAFCPKLKFEHTGMNCSYLNPLFQAKYILATRYLPVTPATNTQLTIKVCSNKVHHLISPQPQNNLHTALHDWALTIDHYVSTQKPVLLPHSKTDTGRYHMTSLLLTSGVSLVLC